MDLVRKILPACEATPIDTEVSLESLASAGYSEVELGYRAMLVMEVRLATGVKFDSRPASARAKKAAASGGGASLAILKAVLTDIATQAALKHAGLK
jgi:hypothetical protein